ncbi:hypothetical protein B0T20DRAFT_116347 [Sordaria brevicollis]|uniref:Uncharacterized protein n=1 Tax=Sordaria brevicollis TaxID=83679 RepID=A0AAE0UEU0_SORBR|nr:hypothetical protein B0T20DRAFT_116347 [Sordaria brevicollis]
MRARPTITSARTVHLLGFLASLAHALTQSQDTPSFNTSTTSMISGYTHLKPSLLHNPVYTPTVNIIQAERNDQDADITTETVVSTVIIPTATELVTIVTTPSAGSSSASTSSTTPQPAEPSPDCVPQGGKDGKVCVTVVPIWPTDTLAPAVKEKRQAVTTSTSTSRPISYKSTVTEVSYVVVPGIKTVTDLLTAVIDASTTYTLTGPRTIANGNGTISDPACTPTDTFATITTTMSTSQEVETTCTMPSSLINGHCTYNSQAGWNPAGEVPTERPDEDHGPMHPVTARAVETGSVEALAAEMGQSEQDNEKEQKEEDSGHSGHSGQEVRKRDIETNHWLVPLLVCLWFGAMFTVGTWMVRRIMNKNKKRQQGEVA